MVYHHPAEFADHKYCGSRDYIILYILYYLIILFYIFYILYYIMWSHKNHVIKGSDDIKSIGAPQGKSPNFQEW